MFAAAVALLAYLIGSIPSGYLVARSQGIDIRTQGSGNIGATNVFRIVGKKWGALVFAADLLKGALPTGLAVHGATACPVSHLTPLAAGLLAGVCSIVGHNFPVWLGFKGGKGIATTAGVLFGLVPAVATLLLLVWIVTFALSRYVSVASIVAAAALPVAVHLFLRLGWLDDGRIFPVALAIGLLAIWRHRTNIKRLLDGTEHRFAKPGRP